MPPGLLRSDEKIVNDHPSRDPIDLLRTIKVMLMADDDSQLSPQSPAIKWIAFETRIDHKLYFFHDGRWFAVAQDYENQVRSEATRILTNRSTLALPPWREGQEEKDYNNSTARDDERYLPLDRKLIRTAAHPRGIEQCDLLGPHDSSSTSSDSAAPTTLAISSPRSTSPLNKLLYDAEGRRALARKVAARSAGKRSAPETPATIVLAIGGRGTLRVDDLFTFSQVTLVRLAQYLETRGIQVQIVALP